MTIKETASGKTDIEALIRTFDPATVGRDFLENPYPTYHLLREHDPVHRCPDGSYFLTRYADLNKVYRDTKRYSSDKKKEFKPKYGDGWLYTHHTTSLVFNDPPLHTRVRRLIMGALTPKALRALEPQLVTLIDSLLDRAEDRQEIDLIEDYAASIPIQVIGDLLGVPMEDRGPLRYWSLTILGALEPRISPAQLEEGNKAVGDFRDYLIGLVAERRRKMLDPEQDVLSRLIAGESDGEKLTEEELLQNCIFLLNAGHETTTSLVGNSVGLLLDHPDQNQLLRRDPDLITTAVEEFLRMESPLQIGNRLAGEDITLGDQVIAKGTYIHTSIAGANRDPAVFEDPDRMDITRKPNRHIAFITGIHVCLGATLARIEGRIAMGKFVQRFPNVQHNGDAERLPLARFRGYTSMPIRV